MIAQRGFTLLEVLISMIILAIGLLGLAAMQAMSLRDNQDAYYYQQATLLAYEMQDRIRGNGIYWSSTVPTPNEGNRCDELSDSCTAEKMAEYDYWYWQDSVESELPKPKDTSTKMVDIQPSSNFKAPNQKGGCKDSYPTSLCLITKWQRINNKDSNKSSKLSDTASFYLEVTP